MSPIPGRSTLITSAPNQASSCVQVGPAWTWLMSRMRTPSSALPASPHGLALGLGIGAAAWAMRPTTGATRLTAVFLGLDFTTFFFTAGFFAAAFGFLDFLRGAIFHPLLYLGVVSRASRHSGEGSAALYFLRTTLCGLRLPMRPLSVPAAGSITALMRVGLPESMASFTARFSSSGVVALTPTPPNASAILS